MIIGISLIAVTALSGAVMMLWNGILTPVLHLSIISFWQAAGILVLSKILFGFGKGRGGMGGHMWKKRMFMKWQSMTPEEQEAFKAKMQGNCRGWGKMNEHTAQA